MAGWAGGEAEGVERVHGEEGGEVVGTVGGEGRGLAGFGLGSGREGGYGGRGRALEEGYMILGGSMQLVYEEGSRRNV